MLTFTTNYNTLLRNTDFLCSTLASRLVNTVLLKKPVLTNVFQVPHNSMYTERTHDPKETFILSAKTKLKLKKIFVYMVDTGVANPVTAG